MDLTQLAEIESQKRRELEEAVRGAAKKLSLKTIIASNRFEPSQRDYWDFKYGDKIELRLSGQGFFYTACLTREEMVLIGDQDLKIKTFQGPSVTKYYNRLAKKMKEEDEANPPLF